MSWIDKMLSLPPEPGAPKCPDCGHQYSGRMIEPTDAKFNMVTPDSEEALSDNQHVTVCPGCLNYYEFSNGMKNLRKIDPKTLDQEAQDNLGRIRMLCLMSKGNPTDRFAN